MGEFKSYIFRDPDNDMAAIYLRDLPAYTVYVDQNITFEFAFSEDGKSELTPDLTGFHVYEANKIFRDKPVEEWDITFNYDDTADVLYVSFGFDEPSFVHEFGEGDHEELIDRILLERGINTGLITGFAVMCASEHLGKLMDERKLEVHSLPCGWSKV